MHQIEVAQTWATHFHLAPEMLVPFIQHYLNSTSNTRCWCIPLGSAEKSPQPVLARVGNQLQHFDGQTLTAYRVQSRHRIPKRKPSAKAAKKLLLRLGRDWWEDALLTSFCQAATEIAKSLAFDDLGQFCGRNISSTGRNNRYFSPRSKFYLTQLGSTLKQFCQRLDQEILFAIRSVQCPSPKLYNWLAQGNRQRRLQALKAQPVLIPLLVIGEEAPWPWDDNERCYLNCPWDLLQNCKPELIDEGYMIAMGYKLAGHIADTGLPLTESLAWLLNVPRMSVRYLGQQRVFDTGSALIHIKREGPSKGWSALLAGAALGNRRPMAKAEWKAFFAVLDKIPWPLRNQASDLSTLFSGCPKSWIDPEWNTIAANLYDLNEVFSHLERDDGLNTRKALQRVKQFTAKATYRQIASLVNDFHHALAEIRIALDAADPQMQSDALTPWSRLLQDEEPILSPNGLQIIELKCPADLEAEHQKLGHCIQTYDFRAYRGDCRLISVRLNNESVASAEIQLLENLRGEIPAKWTLQHLVTKQLRARGNDTPECGSPVDVAYKWFWAKLKSGGLCANLEWPDMTRCMSRYANRDRNSKHAQACAQWLTQHLDRAQGNTNSIRSKLLR